MRYSLSTCIKACLAAVCVLPVFLTASCAKDAKSEGLAVPFSHKTHVENYNISDCGTCHKYNAYGIFMGRPTVGECTECHRGDGKLFTEDRKANPRKKTMFDSFTAADRLWKSKVADEQLYYYSHKIKMTTDLKEGSTRVKCDMCHADKAKTSGVSKTRGGKLMDQCIYCHDSFKLNSQCDVCHR
jgi:hypothetical protein